MDGERRVDLPDVVGLESLAPQMEIFLGVLGVSCGVLW